MDLTTSCTLSAIAPSPPQESVHPPTAGSLPPLRVSVACEQPLPSGDNLCPNSNPARELLQFEEQMGGAEPQGLNRTVQVWGTGADSP